MANSTDSFGKQTFGGATTMATQPTAATNTKTNPYPYAGKGAGYQDPLAQELFKKYTPGMTTKGGPEAFNTLMELSKGYAGTSTNYIDPLNPGNWGAGPMKNEYLQRGGLGTYEQQAQYPGATNWPTDAAGAPLPQMNTQTGQAQSIVPGAPPPSTGSGSSNSLSPDILQKMWR